VFLLWIWNWLQNRTETVPVVVGIDGLPHNPQLKRTKETKENKTLPCQEDPHPLAHPSILFSQTYIMIP
jgi:hypothetical protein